MKNKVKINGRMRVYILWPIVLSILLLVTTLVVGAISRPAGICLSLVTLISIVGSLRLYFYHRKRLLRDLVEFSSEYAWIQKSLLREMETPYAIADEFGRFLWQNDAFQEIARGHRHLSSLFPEASREFLAKMSDEQVSLHSSFEESFYQVNLHRVYIDIAAEEVLDTGDLDGKNALLAIYLIDETDILRYQREITDQKLVAGLIYLDNYEEALDSVEEVRRSMLTALVDRRINRYISAVNGIVRKLEKDKYFFVIKQKHMTALQEKRFSLLEDVKAVNIGNEMSITLSIGVGMGGDTYSQNYDYARAAIDMALGRGGDQAVVKEGSKIRYYGGKSQTVERATRVKARVKAHALRELMEPKDKILIMGHKLGDIDCLGSAVGIYRIAQSFNKKARIVVNSVNSSVKPILKKFKDSPDYPEDMFVTGDQAAEWVDASTMLVVVDVNRPSITEAPQLLNMIKTIVVFDHHRQGAEHIENATLSYVEPYASSACEMVAEILQYVGENIRITPLIADAMYAGIVIDTHNFMNQTGVRTFEAAAYLRRCGADVVRVRKLFRDRLEDYQARAEAIRSAEIYRDVFALAECPAEGLESPSVVGAQAANELLDIVGVQAAFVITKVEDTVYISARSIDDINVQVLMEKIGGGGHRNIAGAQLKEVTAEEVRNKIKALLDEFTEKGGF